jgi:hypothetical protein
MIKAMMERSIPEHLYTERGTPWAGSAPIKTRVEVRS